MISGVAVTRRKLVGVVLLSFLLSGLSSCDSGSEEITSIEGVFASEDAEAIVREKREEAQEAVRLCMAEDGFEYVPRLQTSPLLDRRILRNAVSVSTNDPFTQTEGYGITTAVANVNIHFLSDPNDEIADSLRPEQRNLYRTRLAVCYDQAQSEVLGDDYLDLSLSVSTLIQDLDARIMADPRMIDGVKAWSVCMAAEGYDFSSLEQPRLQVEARAGALFETVTDKHDEGVDPGHDRMLLLPSDEELQELKDSEVELAMTDALCREQAIPGLGEVAAELEAEFLEENIELLIRYRDERDR